MKTDLGISFLPPLFSKRVFDDEILFAGLGVHAKAYNDDSMICRKAIVMIAKEHWILFQSVIDYSILIKQENF